MPEGDAIRRLADTFEAVFLGEQLQVSSPQGRFTAGAERLDGQVLVAARAVGKHMFLGFASPEHAAELAADAADNENDAGDRLQRTESAVMAHSITTEVPAHLQAFYLLARASAGEETGIDTWVHIHLGLYGWWRFNGDASVDDRGHGVVRRNVIRTGPRDVHRPMKWGGGAMNDDAVDVDAANNEANADAAVSALHSVNAVGQADEGDAASFWQAPDPVGQVRLRLLAGHAVADVAGPNRCEIITDDERIAIEAKLGPDPLALNARDDQTSRDRFVAACRKTKRPIGELLMDQKILAGVGNIYRAEVLFLAGISPMRAGERIAVTRLRQLWQLVCDTMNRGLAEGYIVTMLDQDAPAEPVEGDEESSRWYVYHRTGRPCLRCGTEVAEKDMQNRRLFWCPSCQK